MAECNHTKQNSWWIYDGHGIPLKRVCVHCKEEALRGFRPDIMDKYVPDEPIEED